MRRLNPYTYKLRSLLILLPLMLLALSTWTLNRAVTPDLDQFWRDDLLFATRVLFPWLFSVAVAFSVPTFDRFMQIAAVSGIYFFTVYLIPSYDPNIFMNPILCVVTAISAIPAFLPYSDSRSSLTQHSYGSYGRFLRTIFVAALMPLIIFIALATILRQVNTFVLFTFDDTFGRSLLSLIYVPIFIFLQSMGFHNMVGDLLTLVDQNTMITSFVNAVVITDLFSLPAVLFTRSMFAKPHVRLFLTLLVVITIMTASLGACVSLSLLLLLIFYPGSFAALIISGVFCGMLSFFMQAPPVTSVANLYMPDLNLSQAVLFFSSPVAVLEIFTVSVAIILVMLAMLIKKDRLSGRKSMERSLIVGYRLQSDSSAELKLLALLRAFDGISNILDVEVDGSWLYVQVSDRNRVSLTMLNQILPGRLLIDRVNRIFLFETGDQSDFFYRRLLSLIDSRFGEDQYEVSLTAPFDFNSLNAQPEQQAKRSTVQ